MLIPSADRPQPATPVTELTALIELWLSTDEMTDHLVPLLLCAEVEILADLLASQKRHEAADKLRAAHVLPELCDHDHNTGKPLDAS